MANISETVARGASVADEELLQRRLPVEGEVVGGCYRLVALLGEGMFGRVYTAERTDIPEHRVALKVMHRMVYAGRNVERELVMLAAASHPHIVQLKDHGVSADYVWLSMPLFEGETLAQRLERGPLGLREAYEIFEPIARGVQALHERGLRHQDIKPENIFLAAFSDRLHPMLLDLGVAVERNAEFVAGTVLYAAPEQVAALAGAGAQTLSEKIDTYALATTLLRSLVGPDHFPGEYAETPFDLAQAFEDRERMALHDAALPNLTGEPRQMLEQAFGQWMAHCPEDRVTAGQFARELGVLLEQEREAARKVDEYLERQKASLQRSRVVAGAMLLVGAGAAAYGFSKRETLRLAGELERAKQAGARSFDELDTCVASHQLLKRDADSCGRGWNDDKARFQQTLGALTQTSNDERTRLDEQVEQWRNRTRYCHDDARRDAASWARDKAQLTSNWESQLSVCSQERETMQRARDKAVEQREVAAKERAELEGARRSCERKLAALNNTRSECREDLASCIEDRDTCMHNVVARKPPPAPAAPAAPVPAVGDSPAPAPGPSEPSDKPQAALDPSAT